MTIHFHEWSYFNLLFIVSIFVTLTHLFIVTGRYWFSVDCFTEFWAFVFMNIQQKLPLEESAIPLKVPTEVNRMTLKTIYTLHIVLEHFTLEMSVATYS